MSGTSIDGVDLVYANFFYEESWKFKIINSKTYEYDNEWQAILNRILKNNIESVKQIDQNYTRLLSEYILQFINEYKISKIDFVSSHGHTAFHDPSNSLTYQLGNLPELSNYLGLKVICDFRTQDVQFGGQGAPLVPVGEKYLFLDYKTLINLGGFAPLSTNLSNLPPWHCTKLLTSEKLQQYSARTSLHTLYVDRIFSNKYLIFSLSTIEGVPPPK